MQVQISAFRDLHLWLRDSTQRKRLNFEVEQQRLQFAVCCRAAIGVFGQHSVNTCGDLPGEMWQMRPWARRNPLQVRFDEFGGLVIQEWTLAG